MNPADKSRKALLHEIDIVDFAIVEMTEYLDTHPYESEAIDYLNHYVRMKNQLMKEYSYLYGPLTIAYSDTCKNEWIWALAPMPWEGGCK